MLEQSGVHPVMAQVYASRNTASQDQPDPAPSNLIHPSKLMHARVRVVFPYAAGIAHRAAQSGSIDCLRPNLSALLDMVALGAVADVVKLDHNNRSFGSRNDWPALVPARRAVASPPCSHWPDAVEGLDLEGKPVS